MSNKVSGKWAADVYDLLRIFRKINNSVYGLLLSEIGWVVFLVLVSKLSPTGGDTPEPAIVSIPWIGSGGATVEVKVLDLLVPGAAVVFLLWGQWSGLFVYVGWPLIYFLRLVLVAVLMVLGAVAALINVLLLPVTWPIEYLLLRRWERDLDPDHFEKLAKEFGEDQAKKTLYRRAIREVRFNRLILVSWLWPFLIDRVRSVASQGRIGLAPIQSHNYEEDFNAAKVPSQIFSVAITRARWQLENLRRLRHIEFVYLPEHWVPKNPAQARRIRRSLGLDALLWGSYLAEDPNKIWLNVDRNYYYAEAHNKDEITPIIPDIFPWVFEAKPRMLVIDQRNPWDAYVILILTIIQMLESRLRPGSPVTQFVDSLYYGILDINKLIEHLVFDALKEMPSELADSSRDLYPIPRKVLADIAGKWAALQMRPELRSDSSRHEPAHSLVDRLLPILPRCIALDPTIPENYYRLGALQCLAGQVEEATVSFAQARQFEVFKGYSFFARLRASAYLALGELDEHVYSDVALARYVAYAARAINAGGEKAKEVIRAGFDSSRYSKLHDLKQQSGKEAVEAAALNVLCRLLAEDYDPKDQKIKMARHGDLGVASGE